MTSRAARIVLLSCVVALFVALTLLLPETWRYWTIACAGLTAWALIELLLQQWERGRG